MAASSRMPKQSITASGAPAMPTTSSGFSRRYGAWGTARMTASAPQMTSSSRLCTRRSTRCSWLRKNREHLVDLRVQSRLEDVIWGAEAVILAVPHAPYLLLKPEDVVGMAG